MDNSRDDDLEITSVGSLYHGQWDKKYWSSSRGKDRYPYPVGYQAVRTHAGNTYRMEVREGLNGPLFVVSSTDGCSSTDGYSSSGQTPDIAWENFKKKFGPRVKNWHGRRFSSKMDGVELFGFRNPFVQRLLRELAVDVNRAPERCSLSANLYDGGLQSDHKVDIRCFNANSDSIVCLSKHRSIGKRGMKDRIKEGRVKRLHHQDVLCEKESEKAEQLGRFDSHAKEKSIQHFLEEHLSGSFTRQDTANAVNNESLRQSGCELEKDGKYDAIQQATSLEEGRCHPLLANKELSEEVEHSDCVVEKRVISQDESKHHRDFRFPSVENIPYSADYKEGSPREIKDSLQEVSSSPSSSNPSSDKMDLDSEGQELAKFMMQCLLPQAIPLLKKTYVRRKYRRKNHEADMEQKVGDFHLSGDISQGEFGANNIVQRSEGKMSEKNDFEASVQDCLECKITMVKPSDKFCLLNDEQSSERSNKVKYVVPDSLEDDLSIFNVRASKSSPADYCETIHGYPNEIKQNFEPSKMSFSAKEGVVEPSNLESCEYNGVVKPFNELEKGDLFLSDSLLAGLEEEFNGDSAGDKNEISYWEPNYRSTACADHILAINPASDEHDSLQHLCTDKNSLRKDISVRPPEGNFKPTGNDITLQCANNLLPCSEYTSLGEREFSIITDSQRMLVKSQDDLQSSIQHKLVNFDVQNVSEFTDACVGNLVKARLDSKASINIKGNSLLFSMQNAVFRTDCLPSDAQKGDALLHAHYSSKTYDIPLSESIICRNFGETNIKKFATPRKLDNREIVQSDFVNGEAEKRIYAASQIKRDKIRLHLNNMEDSCAHDPNTMYNTHVIPQASVNNVAEDLKSSTCVPSRLSVENNYVDRGTNEGQYYCKMQQHQVKRIVPEQSRKCDLKEFSCPDTKQLTDMATNNDHKGLFHDKPCKRSHFDELSYHDAESLTALDRSMEFVGCFLHPGSVLCISLSSKDHSVQISVLCGLLEDSEKSLYIYVVPLQEQSGKCPSFIGYTSLMLPPLEGPFKGNLTFERAGLQFTPDGRSLILLNSIKVPYCRSSQNLSDIMGNVAFEIIKSGVKLIIMNHGRKQSVACLCPMCKSDQCDDNAVKIVRVNFGYVSPLIKLTTDEKVCCILVCEPNWLIAVQESGKLHVWTMNLEWSTISEEYVLPSFDDMPCSILELQRVTNANTLVIGHNGIGGFGLWDISKRARLASFSAPGNIVFQIIPVGFCSLQNYGILFTNNNVEESLKEMMAKDLSKEAAEIPFLIPSGEDVAVWLMVSGASVTEVQHDLQLKDHGIRWWRLALLAKNLVFMGSVLDPRASVVAAAAEYGIVGTFDGLLYKWELSTGRKYADMFCFECGSVPCIGVDARSGAMAVADGKCHLLIYKPRTDRIVDR